jgi:hypothetical protein
MRTFIGPVFTLLSLLNRAVIVTKSPRKMFNPGIGPATSSGAITKLLALLELPSAEKPTIGITKNKIIIVEITLRLYTLIATSLHFHLIMNTRVFSRGGS